jgi:hypothetical protein
MFGSLNTIIQDAQGEAGKPSASGDGGVDQLGLFSLTRPGPAGAAQQALF